MTRTFTIPSFILLLLLALAACTEEERPRFGPQPDPELGATSFISAATPAGDRYGPPSSGAPTDDRNGEGQGGRTIEEGDIFRALGDGLIVNLNAYRGLQVIDASDPASPRVVGALRTSGSPVELYVFGSRALVLLNDWYGYWGSRTDLAYGKEQGGAALLVDLADPSAPVVLDRAVVPGWIRTSRLVREDATTNLYVAAALWQLYDGGGGTVPVGSGERTVVKSFAVTDLLTARSEIDLGGWISDIQGTPEALIVARTEWTSDSGPQSRVAVVDIGAPDGSMVLGADVKVRGQVKNQFNLDLRGTILRVVSEGGWERQVNHLETFDVSDPTRPVAIDHDEFGAGEALFATLFVGDDKAFFVTYLRQDPFHAFSITADGQATEESAFIVSGWNDFFRAVAAERRLLGVGIDDTAGGRQLAVSLYDITDLGAADPLIARRSAGLESAWSEANWDHRAFSVVEDAVAVPAVDEPAVIETGLVLLPFSGWTEDGSTSGVRLFTFSETTLSVRGALAHATPVRRSFLSDDDTAACLSDESLSLHDVADPDAPAALGEVMLAPSYGGFFVYGDHGLRVVDNSARTYWSGHAPPPGRAEVIALDGDPDRAPAITAFESPAGASITQVGDLAVAMSATWIGDGGGRWQTTVEVWDLTTPTTPQKRGTLTTDALPPSWGPYPAYDGAEPARPADACFDCGYYRVAPSGTVVGEAIAFLEGIAESTQSGTQELCVTVPPGGSGGGVVDPSEPGEPPRPAASSDGRAEEVGVYYTGRIECVRDGDGPRSCWGAIYRCEGLEVECTIVEDPAAIGAETTCKEEPVYRYWTRWVVHVLDLSAPATPRLAEPVALPESEEGVSTLSDGATLWVATREPYDRPDDVRAYVRYFARGIDLATPSQPRVGARVNVPGVLFAKHGDDLFTVDQVYDADHVESAVARARLAGDTATLEARYRLDGRQVQVVLLDGAGHVLLSHGPSTWWYGFDDPVASAAETNETWETRLTILGEDTLAELATRAVDTWAVLAWAGEGRALFQVPGGLLLFDVSTPSAPAPRAFFATAGWPGSLVVDERRAFLAAGLYGLCAFDLDAFDLFAAP